METRRFHALVSSCICKIVNSATEQEISAILADFSRAFDALQTANSAKADALARVNLTREELAEKGLYTQFLQDILDAQSIAISDIKAATEIQSVYDEKIAPLKD